MKKISVLIADDHEIVRTGLSAIFGFQDDFKVIGEACDGEEAVLSARQLKPDIVVMDLMMPVKNGVDATREILETNPTARIVILTTYATSTGIIEAIEAGASGALSKDTPNEELMSALRRIITGEQILSPDIRDLVKAEESSKLTKRQREILKYLTKGLSNLDIAHILKISEDGVKFHLRSIFSKLNVANRAEAATYAVEHHIL